MSTQNMEIGLVIFAVSSVVIFVIATYNYVVRLRNHIDDAWSNIDTELKRRYELISNLVAVVKADATHECNTLEQIIRLRNDRAANSGSVRDYQNRFESFPGNLVAKLSNFTARDLFNVDPAVRVAPSIEGAF